MAIQLMTNRFEQVNKRLSNIEKRLKAIEEEEPEEVINIPAKPKVKQFNEPVVISIDSQPSFNMSELASMLDMIQKNSISQV